MVAEKRAPSLSAMGRSMCRRSRRGRARLEATVPAAAPRRPFAARARDGTRSIGVPLYLRGL